MKSLLNTKTVIGSFDKTLQDQAVGLFPGKSMCK